jgi:hypothetical protein
MIFHLSGKDNCYRSTVDQLKLTDDSRGTIHVLLLAQETTDRAGSPFLHHRQALQSRWSMAMKRSEQLR